MADKYITSVQDILTGFECNTRKDGNPFAGEQRGALRYYKGVKSYDIVSHDEEKALMLCVTDFHIILIVAPICKLTDICTACVAENANYHYEDRHGKLVLRCDDKDKLVRRLLDIDWSDVSAEEESDDNADEAKSDDESSKEATDKAQAVRDARAEAQKKAKADAITAARRRAEAEEAAAKAAANATAESKTPAAPKFANATNRSIDVGDLSDFE